MSEPLVPMVRVSVDLPQFVVQSIDRCAKDFGMSRAEFIREALREFTELSQEIAKGNE